MREGDKPAGSLELTGPATDPDTAVTGAEHEAILAAWQSYVREGWMQEGHWRTIGNDRALRSEAVYGAFCFAWVKARAAERQRIYDGSYDAKAWEVTGDGWRLVPPGTLDGDGDG